MHHGLDTGVMAHHFYGQRAKEATEELMTFVSEVLPGEEISVTYFDEAQELGSVFWVFLRLVQHQLDYTTMWYTFLGTKSRISEYAPPPSECQSVPSLRSFAHI